jgi:hypothetical protein
MGQMKMKNRRKNENGRRLIEHCIENDLIIANTFYTHKDINKITKEVQSRSEKSIIEYSRKK